MSNFGFLQVALPGLHADCATAESYLATDPRSACFYARRAAEGLVGYLYDLLGLPTPYQSDLSARVNAPAFKAATGTGITQKLNLIRKVGNAAVHESAPIPNHAAPQVLRELHHVMVWAAFHHSAAPEAAPTGAQFDPSLAAKAAPLSRRGRQARTEVRRPGRGAGQGPGGQGRACRCQGRRDRGAEGAGQGGAGRERSRRRPRLRRGRDPGRVHRRVAARGGVAAVRCA